MLSKTKRKTVKDYARDLADEIACNQLFIREDNSDEDGQFCCFTKCGDVYTVAYSSDENIIIEKSVFGGWDTIWYGQWNPETDVETFVQRIWNGYTGDKLTEKDEDEESETDMDNGEPLEYLPQTRIEQKDREQRKAFFAPDYGTEGYWFESSGVYF